MGEYEKAKIELFEKLKQFQSVYALGYDVSSAVKRLIEEIEFESQPD